jgi:hypothetical protein
MSAGLLTAALRPPRFSSRVDAIGYVLAQRNVRYEVIYVNRTWPDTVNSIVYGANLRVIMRDRSELPGRVECRTGDHDCYISVDKLGLDRISIPDLTVQRDPPILIWLESKYAEIRAGKLPWRY